MQPGKRLKPNALFDSSWKNTWREQKSLLGFENDFDFDLPSSAPPKINYFSGALQEPTQNRQIFPTLYYRQKTQKVVKEKDFAIRLFPKTQLKEKNCRLEVFFKGSS